MSKRQGDDLRFDNFGSVTPTRNALDQMSQTTPNDQGLHDTPARSDVSFVMLANVILDNRRLIAGFAIVFFLAAVAWALVQPRTYTSTVSFVTESSSGGSSSLAGIAAQFGVNFPAGQTGQSPEFYRDLLHSRALLGAVAESDFVVSSEEPSRRSLPEWYGIGGSNPERVRNATIKELNERVSTGVGRETGIVRLGVTGRQAELAAGLSARMLELLNEFNLETRQSEAAAERAFIEARQLVVAEDLTEAEDRLETFMRSNRQFERSPELSFEHDRLLRDVSLKQQVATTLAQAYEQARIDEVRNTPVITVIDPPEVPVLPDRRHLIFKSLVAIMLGITSGMLFAFAREYARRDRVRDRDAFDRFDELRRETADDIRRLRVRIPRRASEGE